MRCVAVAGDPGGARALAPVIDRMRRDSWTVDALAYGEAGIVWASMGIAHLCPCEALWQEQASVRLALAAADLLLCATSWRPEHRDCVELEKCFIDAARRLGVPSLAVLDFWSNYRQRFADPFGRLIYTPDRIAVMDEFARDEMISEGFAPENLIVTGQPAFERLATWKLGFDDARRRSVRAKHGIACGETMVLFLSQPISTMYGPGGASHRHPGFDERTVLPALLTALDELADRDRPAMRLHLVVLPHLREDPSWLLALRPRKVRLSLADQDDPHGLLMAADLVTGMTSTRLVEACYLGRRAVSLQPESHLPDPLPTNHAGLSRGIYSYAGILPAIEQELAAAPVTDAILAGQMALQQHQGAAQRIAALAATMAMQRMETR